MSLDPNYTALTAEVRTRLVQEFSLEELRDLCFDLGIDYELFPQQQHTMARELVGYLHRRRRIPQLVERMQAIRPDDDYAFVERAGIEFSQQTQPIPPVNPLDETEDDGIEVAWTRQLDARPHQKPWLMGNVYVVPAISDSNGTYSTTLYALDASMGELRWRHHFDQYAFSGHASLPDGVLVTLSSTDVLMGVAQVLVLAMDGHRRWYIDCDGQQVSAPAVFGDRAVVVVDARTCLVLDVRSGVELTRFTLPQDAADTAPLATSNLLYFPCRGPNLLATSWDGLEEWSYDAGTVARISLGRTPAHLNKRLVTVSSTGQVIALHPESGVVDWDYDPGVRLHTVMDVLHDGELLYCGGDAVLYALESQSGDELWLIDTQDVQVSTVSLHGEMLVAADAQGRISAYYTPNGQVLWQHTCDSRIETVFTVMPDHPSGPMVICADILGKVSAFHYPVSATEHESSRRWNLAAQVWETQGECVRAAKSWERHAKYLDGHGALDTLQAKSWESAAKMWLAVGEAAQAERCQRNRAKFLKLPFITARLEHKGVVAGAYSQLHVTLENSGYGIALEVELEILGDTFEIGPGSQLSLAHLSARQKRIRTLDVRPTAHGDAVPLQIAMRYKDASGRTHRVRDTIYVSVTPENSPLSPEQLALFARATLSDLQDTRSEVVMDVALRPGNRAYSLEIALDDGQTFSSSLPLTIAEKLPITGIKAQGQYLFDLLFGQGEARDAWSNALGQSLANDIPRRLRLRIDESLSKLAALPWESMYAGDLMLSASDQILFSRNLPVKWVDVALDTSQPLRVLIVVSNPEDIYTKYQLPPLEAVEEKAILTQAMKRQSQREVQLHIIKTPVTLDRLRRAVRSGYDMMHIIGHGYVNPRSGTSGVILETANGRSRAVSWPQFAQLFAQVRDVPALMYFSVCQRSSSHFVPQPQTLPSVMIRAGIPAVVAMQDRIAITANRVLTQQFYTDLMQHGTVDQALQSARATLLAKELKGAETPVLYSQMPTGRLW